MNELVKVNVDVDGIQTVNARELHEFLESRQDYSTWIKSRISKYAFVEDRDYTSLHKIMERASGGGTTRIEYHISIGMAKELSMVEDNEKGHEARQYFIAMEKKAKADTITFNGVVLPNFNDPLVSARAWADQCEGRMIAEKENRALQISAVRNAPKIDFYNAVIDSDGAISMEETAKLLGIPGFGRNKLFSYLRKYGVLTKDNIPYQKYMDAGWFNVVENSYTDDFATHVSSVTRVYQKGMDGIQRSLKKRELFKEINA